MRVALSTLFVLPLIVCLAGCEKNSAPPPVPPPTQGSSADTSAPKAKDAPQPEDAAFKITLERPPANKTDSALLDELMKAVEEPKSPSNAVASDAPGAQTLDLSPLVLYRAEEFDMATDFPWPAMPRGTHTFVNVPVDISGAIFLWGARNEAAGMVYPKSLPKIPVGRKAEVIYVFHTAFFESEPGEAVFEIVCHYPDKDATLGPIVCGGDTHDWFVRGDSTTTNERSTLAWSGEGKAGERDQKIQMFVTALDNPHPEEEIVSLDLVSSEKQAAGCIFGLTVGPKGLLKKTSEKEAASQPQQ